MWLWQLITAIIARSGKECATGKWKKKNESTDNKFNAPAIRIFASPRERDGELRRIVGRDHDLKASEGGWWIVFTCNE